MSPKTLWFVGTTTLMLALDQGTKVWTQQTFAERRPDIEVIPGFLSFTHAENPGAAFSTLADSEHRMYVFGIFAVTAVIALVYMWWQLEPKERFRAAAIGLILSGALGNSIDRVYKQSVTDFVKVYWGPEGAVRSWLESTFHTNVWPIWNVADAAILIGVALFFIEPLLVREKAADADPGENPLSRPDPADARAS